MEYEYTYNTIGYLIKVKRNGIVMNEYIYDDNGNRTMQLMTIDSVYATYDEQDRMLSYGSTQYIYTSSGNLSMKVEGQDTTHYSYDAFGNLLNVSLPPQAGQANGDVIDYIIDGLNRRIGKKVNGLVTNKWLYQDQLNPVVELDSNNNVLQRFVYGTKMNVPDYIVKGDSTYRVVTDHLGSVRLVVNSESGYVVQEIKYDEFGNVLLDTKPGWQPFYFAGGLYDEQTKLVRFGARDYDAVTGRWTAKDPIFFGGGVSNLYEYCLNDPVNRIDLNGLWDAEGHTNLTILAMQYFDFSPDDIQKVVQANIDADFFVQQIPSIFGYVHYMKGSEEGASKRIYGFFAMAVQAECKGNHDAALAYLGGALHTVQDFWAHAYQGITDVTHWTDGVDPDNPGKHPYEYNQAFLKSMEFIEAFLRQLSLIGRNN